MSSGHPPYSFFHLACSVGCPNISLSMTERCCRSSTEAASRSRRRPPPYRQHQFSRGRGVRLLEQTTADRNQHAHHRRIEQPNRAELIDQPHAGSVVFRRLEDYSLPLVGRLQSLRSGHAASAGPGVEAKALVLLVKPFAMLTNSILNSCGCGKLRCGHRPRLNEVVDPRQITVGDQGWLAHLSPRRRSPASRGKARTIRRCAFASLVAFPCFQRPLLSPKRHNGWDPFRRTVGGRP